MRNISHYLSISLVITLMVLSCKGDHNHRIETLPSPDEEIAEEELIIDVVADTFSLNGKEINDSEFMKILFDESKSYMLVRVIKGDGNEFTTLGLIRDNIDINIPGKNQAQQVAAPDGE